MTGNAACRALYRAELAILPTQPNWHHAAFWPIFRPRANSVDSVDSVDPQIPLFIELRIDLQEVTPTEIFIVGRDPWFLADDAFAFLEKQLHRVHLDAERVCGALLLQLIVIQELHEEQICDLLQHRDGACDAASPYGIPYSVDFISQFACDHRSHLVYFIYAFKFRFAFADPHITDLLDLPHHFVAG